MSSWTRRFARTAIAAVLLVAMLGLSACQSVPARKTNGFTPEQIAVLREQGFHQTPQGWEFDGSDEVLFGLNVAELSPQGQDTVARIGRALLGVGITSVQLYGFTDNTGTHDYNVQLSDRRAHAVAAGLTAIGMSSANILIKAMGESDPVASNDTREGRAENRRVAIIVTSR
jgi:outer membrane protein OmpA-like peptidoglycan-associated protein